MSVDDAVARTATRTVPQAASWPVTRLLGSELALIFRRRRNIAGLGVLAVVPVIIAIAVKVALPRHGPGGADFFRDITGNGMFVALAALTVELPLFLPLAVAGDVGDGPHRELRLMLVGAERPHPQAQPAAMGAVGGGDAHLLLHRQAEAADDQEVRINE